MNTVTIPAVFVRRIRLLQNLHVVYSCSASRILGQQYISRVTTNRKSTISYVRRVNYGVDKLLSIYSTSFNSNLQNCPIRWWYSRCLYHDSSWNSLDFSSLVKVNDECEGPREKETMVRILNVAEKNDAAKNIAEIISRGHYNRREGFSQYNKIYEFDTMLNGQQCHMVMTSVSGHLLNHEFTGNYRIWRGCNPIDLFDAPVCKGCHQDYEPIKRTLEREARAASRLIIWTDCDREGENIGFEIINVCKAIKPSLPVQRAKFSEITFQSIQRALQTLGPPDEKQSNAVDVRSELDLRIGAAFTRFQTLRLQKVFPQHLANTLISYGSCQFPTLGFVVERYKAIQQFVAEAFWKIKVTHAGEEGTIEFSWQRVRLFDQLACQVLYEMCQEQPQATVTKVTTKSKSKWRPLPLDTVEFEKSASRKLRINAKEAMKIAEKLYTQGYISYPRTETNIFPKELNLVPLVEMQTPDPNWGGFAAGVLEAGPNPRQGRKSDQAHPPIHPTKYTSNLQGDEKKVYEFVVRHFLACLSKDAQGMETIVEIEINGEGFTANGLMILERNYLDVYPYDRWSDKVMPRYERGQVFTPTSIEMIDGETSPPNLLTEADLIALMEKHGIGTDATHAEHIETIKSRMYVGLQDIRFIPGQLGMGLVEGYDSMGFQMSKPNLRAELEADLKRICEGTRDHREVLREQIAKYRHVFQEAMRQANKIDVSVAQFLNEEPQGEAEDASDPFIPQITSVSKCPSCACDLVVRQKRDGVGYYLTCQGFPECRASVWFPDTVLSVTVTDVSCSQCVGSPKKLRFKFKPRSYMPYIPDEYETCIFGCDQDFLDVVGIRALSARPSTQGQGRTGSQNNRSQPRSSNTSSDSGYSSSFNPTIPNSNQRVITFGLNSNNNNNDNLPRRGNNNGMLGQQPSPRPNRPQGHNNTRGNSTRTQQGSGLSSFGSSQPPYRPSWDGGGRNDDRENAIVCNCNEDAIMLTVRKEGPNTGRPFYKCSRPQGQGCNFFLWGDDGRNDNDGGGRGSGGGVGRGHNSNRSRGRGLSQQNNYAPQWNGGFDEEFPDDPGLEGSEITCNCGDPAKRLTTQKEGPNKGRDFYVCSKDRSEQCRFFKWADEVDDSGGSFGGNSQWSGGTSQRGGYGRGGRGANTNRAAKRKMPGEDGPKRRKCGVCGEEGHNRKNCPHKDF